MRYRVAQRRAAAQSGLTQVLDDHEEIHRYLTSNSSVDRSCGSKLSWVVQAPAATLIGKPLESINLVDLAGSKHDISELTGQPTTVYFWASWCKPCLETLRDLAQGRKAPPKEHFVAIAIDDDQALVKDMIQRTGFKGQVLIATDGMKLIQQRYAGNDMRAVPYVVKLNASGEMVARRYGL